jgi:hypothetical protein
MTQVASIPDAPPLTKGFTVGHTPVALDFFSSPIIFLDSKSGRLGAQRERERESKRKKNGLSQNEQGEKERGNKLCCTQKNRKPSLSLSPSVKKILRYYFLVVISFG